MNIRACVFLDIDGTLLDSNYKSTFDELTADIHAQEARGYLFGCNSNRAREDILPVLEKFQINGPAIAENGCYFFTQQETTPVLLAPVEPIRPLLETALQQACNALKTSFIYGDTVALESRSLQEKKIIYVVNKFRLYTASIHVFFEQKRNLEAAQKLCEVLRPLMPLYDISVSSVFCNVLVSPKNINKASGLNALKTKLGNVPMIGVGDDAADIPLRPFLKKLFAVANAESDLKNIADYVSTEPYTKGVADIINHLDDLIEPR